MIHVLVPLALRDYVAGRDAVDVTGETVSAAIDELLQQHPALRRHLYDDSGALRGYVNIYLNDEEVRDLAAGGATSVQAGDTLMIVPSIAGG
jgi:molybdopterin converting factor small subunit